MAENNWWQQHRPSTRRLVQLYAALLYNANIRGFVEGRLYTGNTKAICVPGLNCYSCPGAIGACPLGALQNALASSSHTAGWYVFGILLLFGITLGRTICGWICPMGLIQELLHRIPTPKIRKSRITRGISWLKYVILAVFVIALPIYFGVGDNTAFPAFCKFICPAGTLEGAIALLAHPDNEAMFAQLGLLFTNKYVILVILGMICIFCYRSFCRFLCPLGALYSLFNRFALVSVRMDPAKCNHCGACVRHCEMDIRHVGDHECISCGKCISTCAQGAISLKCGKRNLKTSDDSEPQKKQHKRILWGILVAILAFVLVYYNFIAVPENTVNPSNETQDLLTGYEVGQQLEDFTCELTDGSLFHLADMRGKIVLINQWATYCTPCIQELPYFEQLQEAFPDLVILAYHHWLESSPKALPFIEEKGWNDWSIKFAVDTPDMNIMQKTGGDNVMPRTLVLDKDGVVVYNEQRSVTYEMLLSLLALASE